MKTLFKTFLVLGFLLVAGALLLGWGLIHVLGDVPGVHRPPLPRREEAQPLRDLLAQPVFLAIPEPHRRPPA